MKSSIGRFIYRTHCLTNDAIHAEEENCVKNDWKHGTHVFTSDGHLTHHQATNEEFVEECSSSYFCHLVFAKLFLPNSLLTSLIQLWFIYHQFFSRSRRTPSFHLALYNIPV